MKVIVSRNPLSNKNQMFENIREDLKKGKRIYLIVPEQSTLSTEIDIFNYFNFDSIMDLKVKSFKSIINEILLKEGGLKLNYLSEHSQKLILKIAINQVKDQIKVYSKSLNKQGFSQLILDFIKVIKSNLINPEQLKIINENANYDDALKAKISDVQIIYDAYQKLIRNSSYDSHDRMDFAIDKIKNMHSYKNVVFYIDLFSNMSKQEIAFVKQLDQISNNMAINVTIDPNLISNINSNVSDEMIIDDAEVFEVSKRFIKSLDYKNLEFEQNFDSSHENPQIDLLLKNIFSYKLPKDSRKLQDNLSVDESNLISDVYIERYKNTDEECEMLAININKDISKNKLRYKDIAVVVTDKEEYYDKIKRQFKLNDISFFMDTHRDLLENPIAKYIKSAISLLGSNFSHEYIISYLKNAFFNLEQYDINIFQNFLAQRRIIGSMIFQDKYFNYDEKKIKKDNKYKEEDIAIFEKSEEIRKVFIDSISNFGNSMEDIISKRNEKDTLKNYCKKIYNFISLNQAQERIKDFEDSLELKNKNEIIEENRLVWNKFINILDDFSKIDENLKVTFEEFSKYLEEAMSDIKIGIVPPSKDQIQIGDLDRSRFNQIKKLYVLGMTNLYFPKSHKDADLLLESEKEMLIEHEIEIENTNSKYSDKDLFALYNVISKARSKIVFTYSLVNSSNNAMEESRILQYIKALIRNENYKLNPCFYEDFIYSKTKLSYYLPTQNKKIKNNKKIENREKYFVTQLIEQIKDKERYSSIVDSLDSTRFNNKYCVQENRLQDYSINKAFPDSRQLSISQIEQYISCPYRHFISYGIKPREDNCFNLDPLSFGNIVHNSVDTFIKKYAEDEFESQSQIEEIMSTEIQGAISDNISSYQMEDYRNKYYVKNLVSMLNVSLFALSKQYIMIKPNKTYTEVLFGNSPYAIFPSIDYQVDDKKYQMKGIIDRVDEYDIEGRRYFRVIDYKTGNKKFDLLKVYHGLDLQLMIYLYTVSKLKNSSPLGAFYMRLNHRFKNMGISELQDKNILDKHRLDGLVYKNKEILEKTDKSFNPYDKPNSSIIEVKKTIKDYTKQPNFINEKTFNNIFSRSNEIIRQSIKSIKNGNIEAKPYKLKDKIPCTFCQYKTICKFKQNNYRILKNYKNQELLEILGDENEWIQVNGWTRKGRLHKR